MRKNVKAIIKSDATVWVNMLLLGAASLLLFYYIIIADRISSKNYKFQSLQNKIESLSEANTVLMSQKLSLDNPSLITNFAQSHNLVEAKNVSYIFENKDVAKK